MNEGQVRYNCAIDATMSVIEGRWKGTILCMLHRNGPMRFSELQRAIGEVSSRILSKQLRELEADRMVLRTAEEGNRVSYELTSRGITIIPVLESIGRWGMENRFVDVIVPE